MVSTLFVREGENSVDYVSHLKEGFSTRSSGLEHDGQDGEDDDLDGGTTSVPVGPADSILMKFKDFKTIGQTKTSIVLFQFQYICRHKCHTISEL